MEKFYDDIQKKFVNPEKQTVINKKRYKKYFNKKVPYDFQKYSTYLNNNEFLQNKDDFLLNSPT